MSYGQRISMEAFKESGAIEYSSDVLIGLQLRGAGRGDLRPDGGEKEKSPAIEAVILKNRNGRVGEKIEFEYTRCSIISRRRAERGKGCSEGCVCGKRTK